MLLNATEFCSLGHEGQILQIMVKKKGEKKDKHINKLRKYWEHGTVQCAMWSGASKHAWLVLTAVG